MFPIFKGPLPRFFQGRFLGLTIQFVAGVFAVLVALSLTILLLVVFGQRIQAVPLMVKDVQTSLPESVCPGEEYVTTVTYYLNTPLAIETYWGFVNQTKDFSYTNVLDGHAMTPHPGAGTYGQPIVWSVPDLPPQKYNLAITMILRGMTAAPVPTYVLFTIGTHCN